MSAARMNMSNVTLIVAMTALVVMAMIEAGELLTERHLFTEK